MILTNKEALDRLGDGAHLGYDRLQHIAGVIGVKKSGKRTELVQRIQAKLATLPPGEASGFSDEIIPVAAAAPRTAESDEIRAPEEQGWTWERIRGMKIQWRWVFAVLGLLTLVWALAQAFRGQTPMEVFSQDQAPVSEPVTVDPRQALMEQAEMSVPIDPGTGCKAYRVSVYNGRVIVTAVNPVPGAEGCTWTSICERYVESFLANPQASTFKKDTLACGLPEQNG